MINVSESLQHYVKDYKEHIEKIFNRDFNGINPNYEIEDEIINNEIMSQTYLASKMQVLDNNQIVLSIFVNLRLKI